MKSKEIDQIIPDYTEGKVKIYGIKLQTLRSAYNSERQLRYVFGWLARTRFGVPFGSRPISWYQHHNCTALDVLLDLTRDMVGVLRTDGISVWVAEGSQDCALPGFFTIDRMILDRSRKEVSNVG